VVPLHHKLIRSAREFTRRQVRNLRALSHYQGLSWSFPVEGPTSHRPLLPRQYRLALFSSTLLLVGHYPLESR
jgi:hypothetical protein